MEPQRERRGKTTVPTVIAMSAHQPQWNHGANAVERSLTMIAWRARECRNGATARRPWTAVVQNDAQF